VALCFRGTYLDAAVKLASAKGLPADNNRAPFIGSYVASVTGEQPVMTSDILGSILAFAIFGLVQFLHNPGTRGLRSLEVRINVVDEYGGAPKIEKVLAETRIERS
jgi:hypothetical protein